MPCTKEVNTIVKVINSESIKEVNTIVKVINRESQTYDIISFKRVIKCI